MRRVRVDFAVDDSSRAVVALIERLVDPSNGQLLAEDVVVDLGDCGFLGPTAVVTLCGLRRLARAGGRVLGIEPPRRPQLLAYCRYSGLLADFGVGDPPDAHPDNVTTRVRSFTEQLPEEAIREIVTLAKREMTLPAAAEDDLKSVLAGLSKRHSVTSDKEAIQRALVSSVTGRGSSRNLGLGLAHLHAVVRITGGRMVIYSGHGVFWHELGLDHARDPPWSYPGTVAFVRLPARSAEVEGPGPVDIWE